MWRTGSISVLCLLVFACGDDVTGAMDSGPPVRDAGAFDAGSDAGYLTFDAGDAASYDGGVIPCTASDMWLEVLEIHRDKNVVIERVEYCSELKRIEAQICRPVTGTPGPVIAYAHDGFGGLESDWANPASTCGVLAANGYVVVEPSFRGQDESQGMIEICLGEAADLDQAFRTAAAQPYSAFGRAGMLGFGHGGCVAMVALESRRTPVQVAITINPQVDWVRSRERWLELRETAEGMLAGQLDQLVALIEMATGGAPGASMEVDMVYEVRSPLRKIDDLIAFPGGLFVVQGTDDPFTPVEPACTLAAMLPETSTIHFLSDGSIGLGHPACSGTVTEWATVVPRGVWPDSRYVGIYDGAGELFVPGTPTFNDTVDYLTTRLPR